MKQFFAAYVVIVITTIVLFILLGFILSSYSRVRTERRVDACIQFYNRIYSEEQCREYITVLGG